MQTQQLAHYFIIGDSQAIQGSHRLSGPECAAVYLITVAFKQSNFYVIRAEMELVRNKIASRSKTSSFAF